MIQSEQRVMRLASRLGETREEAMSKSYRVEEVTELSPERFKQEFVAERRPVVLRGALKLTRASSEWTVEGLRRRRERDVVTLKEWSASGIKVTKMQLGDYLDQLIGYERDVRDGSPSAAPAYLHDVPLTSLFDDAATDLAAFPAEFFSSWYGGEWMKFAQMFLGPTGSLTPLHFDCLLTHNLFFQVWGQKRFTLFPYEDLKKCYPYDWRWCRIDVERPDYEAYPLFREANGAEVVVGPSDMLYMPPGTLHHVRSLDCALSFNVDWHTKDSALSGILALARGMPLKNVYYNALIALGVWGGLPRDRVLHYYRPYLSYIS